MTNPYIIIYILGDDGTRRYMVIHENALFDNEQEALDYRDRQNAKWKKEQQWRDRIKSLCAAYRKENP